MCRSLGNCFISPLAAFPWNCADKAQPLTHNKLDLSLANSPSILSLSSSPLECVSTSHVIELHCNHHHHKAPRGIPLWRRRKTVATQNNLIESQKAAIRPFDRHLFLIVQLISRTCSHELTRKSPSHYSAVPDKKVHRRVQFIWRWVGAKRNNLFNTWNGNA